MVWDKCTVYFKCSRSLNQVPWVPQTSKFGTHWNTSVKFSLSIMSDSLWPHGLQHARPPCPSPTPRLYSNSCQLSQWCHPAISSCVIPFSSCPQSLPASGSFPMSQVFAWGGQSIGVSVSASVLPMNTQNWFPLLPRSSPGWSRVFEGETARRPIQMLIRDNKE